VSDAAAIELLRAAASEREGEANDDFMTSVFPHAPDERLDDSSAVTSSEFREEDERSTKTPKLSSG
jgi:hypothetical protein